MTEPAPVHDQLLRAAAEVARARRDAVVKKVRDTMKVIDAEIAANHGLYPYPGKKLGQREFCRRAGIHFQTLQSAAHKHTTRLELEAFFEKHKPNSSKQEIKAAVAEKVNYWKGEHDKIATQVHLYELKLSELDDRMKVLQQNYEKQAEVLQKEIDRLTAENAALRDLLPKARRGEKVTPIRK